MKLKATFFVTVLLMTGVIFTGCGDNIKYGSIEGKATGTIDFTEEVPDVEIDNIIAEIGEEIDYTGELELIGTEDLSNYQVSVNTTDVKTDEPGTYTATYTITYDDKTFTKQVTVTVKGDAQSTTATTPQQTTQQTTQQATQQATQQTTTSSNTTTTAPTSGSQTQTSSVSTSQSQGVPVAEIELLSGEVVSITCTNSKYIISTRTDVSEVTRNGIKYSVEKLIITYNTGTEQILETIERKIS